MVPTSSGNAETQLQSLIGKFEPKNQTLIHPVRTALRKRLPSANELVYDNYNFFVIGYSSTERPSDSYRLPSCRSERIGLSFPYSGASLPDPQKLLGLFVFLAVWTYVNRRKGGNPNYSESAGSAD